MRLRKALRKIHRWVGLLSALWLLQLLMTGLLLQHSDDLKLGEKYVTSPSMLQWFGYGKRQHIWDIDNDHFYQIDDVIGFNQQLAKITGAVVGVAKWSLPTGSEVWVVATSSVVIWYSSEGDIIERFDDFDGLPTPVVALQVQAGQVYIKSQNQWYLHQSTGAFILSNENIHPLNDKRTMTAAEQDLYFASALDKKLSYDKVLHGIHSGVQGSKWLNSLSALALLYLCLSGIYLFFKQPKRRR